MSDLDRMTPAEHARLIAAVEAQLPRPMRNPDGVVRIVSADRCQQRLDAGWTYATTDHRAA